MAQRLILISLGCLAGAGAVYFSAVEPAKSAAKQAQQQAEAARAETKAAQQETEQLRDELAAKEALACFDFDSDADVVAAKKRVMSFVDADDIEKWASKNATEREEFLRSDDYLRWSQGEPVEEIPFEEDLVQAARGAWRGQVNFASQENDGIVLNMDISFGKISKNASSPHKITITSTDGGYKSTLIFRRGPLATYPDKEISLVFASPIPEGIDGTSHYGFRFDPGLKKGATAQVEVFGLTTDLKWVAIGNAKLTRKK